MIYKLIGTAQILFQSDKI